MPYDDLKNKMMLANSAAITKDTCILWELFSPPRVSKVLIERGYWARRTFDVKHGWDLTQEQVRRSLVDDLIAFQPFFLMCSPPCTSIASLAYSNWSRSSKPKREAKLVTGLQHVDTTIWACDIQDRFDRFYCLENPQRSELWNRPNAP